MKDIYNGNCFFVSLWKQKLTKIVNEDLNNNYALKWYREKYNLTRDDEKILNITILDIEYELEEDKEWQKLKSEIREKKQQEDYDEDYIAMGGNPETKLTKEEIDEIFNDDDFLLNYTEEDVKKLKLYMENKMKMDDLAY